jgi:hypothetical protein
MGIEWGPHVPEKGFEKLAQALLGKFFSLQAQGPQEGREPSVEAQGKIAELLKYLVQKEEAARPPDCGVIHERLVKEMDMSPVREVESIPKGSKLIFYDGEKAEWITAELTQNLKLREIAVQRSEGGNLRMTQYLGYKYQVAGYRREAGMMWTMATGEGEKDNPRGYFEFESDEGRIIRISFEQIFKYLKE